MANVTAITAKTFIEDTVNPELRNSRKLQYKDKELFGYINEAYRLIHGLLIQFRSDLALASGDFTATAGDTEFSLTAAELGGLWYIYKIWSLGQRKMNMLTPDDFETRRQAAELGTLGAGPPSEYFLEGDELHLFNPAATDTTVKVKYFPYFSPLVATFDQNGAFTDTPPAMPLNNAFNQVILGLVLVRAKNRNADGSHVDVSLLELAQEGVLAIVDRRQEMETAMVPDFNYYSMEA